MTMMIRMPFRKFYNAGQTARFISAAGGLFLFLCLLFTYNGEAQPLSSAAIDSIAERARTAFDVPGIAVAVIKDGKLVHAKGYGVRALRTGLPVDENTLFGIASNSKAFTAAAIGMLVDAGKCAWDDKVRKYIPEFKLYDPFVTEEFTIRDLLTHRSGLGLGAGDLMFFPDSSDFVLKDVLHNLQFLKPVSSFRSRYDYDNNLYIVAGEVVARVSGMSWEDFVETKIMQPLGMTHSAAAFTRLKDTTDIIDAHAAVDGTVRKIARSTLKIGHSAGGINAGIADLAKWIGLFLNDGVYGNNQRLFSKEVQRELWTPQTIIRFDAPGPYQTHFAAYGLGFVLTDVKGYKQISHTGGLEGMVTQITMIPELRLGIIVLTNQQETGAFSSITNEIKDAYFGLPASDWVGPLAAARERNRVSAKRITDSLWAAIAAAGKAVGKIDFNIYAGLYRDAWFGDVVVSSHDGKFWIQSKRSPKIGGELLPFKGNCFIAKWRDRSMDADAYVNFSLDETGRGAGISMKPISPLTDFSYDFQDLDLKRIP